MVDVQEIKMALLDVAENANGQKPELREALRDVLAALDESPADRIRLAVAAKPRPIAIAARKKRHRKTPPEEVEQQFGVIVDYLKHQGPCEVGDLLIHLLDECDSLYRHPNPRSTASGRIASAIREGLVVTTGTTIGSKGQLVPGVKDLVDLADGVADA